MNSIKSSSLSSIKSFGLLPIILFFILPLLRQLIQQSYDTNNDHLQQVVFHPTFPPTELSGKELELWFNQHISNHKLALPDPSWSAHQKSMARMSVTQFIQARKINTITCLEYTDTLIDRAIHYAYQNGLMYTGNERMFDTIRNQAKVLDERVEKEGIESIAPFYCLPVAAKGTMATIDFQSSVGVGGKLHNAYATRDAESIARLKQNGGVVFGKSNVPEFAASFVSCNYSTGCTLNPYGYKYTTGGSSGGAASLVASYILPIAFSEDTGGSTRHPAAQTQLFGYDPSRNRYPNAGNPGITFLNDQVGVLARNVEDILAFDSAFLNLEEGHANTKLATPKVPDIRVGLPQYPFVEYWVPEEGSAVFTSPKWPQTKKVSPNILNKYMDAVNTLRAGQVQLVEEEWPDSETNPKMNTLEEHWHIHPNGFDPIFDPLVSFPGQAITFIRSYLNVSITMDELLDEIKQIGSFHTPGPFMDPELTKDRSESNFRYAHGAFQMDTVLAWNTYFDQHQVDMILTPVSFCDAVTYECAATDGCKLQMGTEREDYKTTGGSLFEDCNSLFLAFKSIPIPKVVVPIGLDVDGNPSSVIFWGRSGPQGMRKGGDWSWLYDDDFTRDNDLQFLYKVNSLVSVLHKEPSLQRSLPHLVTVGDNNLF